MIEGKKRRHRFGQKRRIVVREVGARARAKAAPETFCRLWHSGCPAGRKLRGPSAETNDVRGQEAAQGSGGERGERVGVPRPQLRFRQRPRYFRQRPRYRQRRQ